ncbi:hypothetical protein OSTOST_26199 [Ostertagia ostertagi]
MYGEPVGNAAAEKKPRRKAIREIGDVKVEEKRMKKKAVPEGRRHVRHSDVGIHERHPGTESPNLEKHVEAIRERRSGIRMLAVAYLVGLAFRSHSTPFILK